MTILPPHFSVHKAPEGAIFTHFEAQSVMELDDFSGGSFHETYTEENMPEEDDETVLATYIGVYGKLPDGGVEHIADRDDEDAALLLIQNLGGAPA